MQMTPQGRAVLAEEEGGHVLTAYLDSARVWTISVGLTAASGVVKPHRGMVISQAESERLFALALPKYERRTARAMPMAKPHEFDGGCSFDFNTGAINRATWVTYLAEDQPVRAEQSLKLWNKAGGKTIRGLINRRAREANMIFRNEYSRHARPAESVLRYDAKQRIPAFKLGAIGPGVTQLQGYLKVLGYKPGEVDGKYGVATANAVRAFQRAHPHLKNDGIAGTATLAQIQRNLDARKKLSKTVSGGVAGGAATGGSNELAGGPDVTNIPTELLLLGAGALTLLVAVFFAWQYREVIEQRFNKWRGA